MGVVMTVANCLGLVVFVPMVSRLFVERRSMMIAILQSANGIAHGVSAPLIQLLFSGIAWRTTYLVQAPFMAAAVLPLAAVFRRADPRQVGGNSAPHSADPAWLGLGEAMRTPHFWLLFAVYLFTGLGSLFVSLHQFAFAIDIGFDGLYAAGVLGSGAFLAVPGSLVTGPCRITSVARCLRSSSTACRFSGPAVPC